MKKAVAAYMTLAFSAAMSGGSVFAEPHIGGTRYKSREDFDRDFNEQLAKKGLQRYTINGKEIIAHNEREAIKRYRHNYK